MVQPHRMELFPILHIMEAMQPHSEGSNSFVSNLTVVMIELISRTRWTQSLKKWSIWGQFTGRLAVITLLTNH